MRQNPVVHLELHTGDLPQARAVYAELCGWRREWIRTRDGSYLFLELGDGFGGGIVECGTEQARDDLDLGVAQDLHQVVVARRVGDELKGPGGQGLFDARSCGSA